MNDPYPGYYQKQSGEWAAYDPEYYKSFWETWNLEAVSGTQGKGKRKERGWEGAEADDTQSVDAHEEMQKSQLAEMEATKNLTAAPNAPSAQPKMNIKVCALSLEDMFDFLTLSLSHKQDWELCPSKGSAFVSIGGGLPESRGDRSEAR